MIFTARIPGTPIGKGRPRATAKGHVYTPKKTRQWEERAADILRKAAGETEGFETITEPAGIGIVAVFPRPVSMRTQPDEYIWRPAKPDADNILKAVCDAAQKAEIVSDDSVFVEMRAQKVYAPVGAMPFIAVEIKRTGDVWVGVLA